MKKVLLGFAALSLLATLAISCKNETVEKRTDNQISFFSAVGKQTVGTRAAEWTNASWVAGNTFPVRAFVTASGAAWTTPQFTLSFDGAAWTYTEGGGAIMQPGYSLDYYAYFPIANVTGFTKLAYPNTATFNYTVQAVASQEDLIAASRSTTLPEVDLNFGHVLSQVNFAVLGIPHVQITVSNISVNGVSNAGVFTYGSPSSWGTLTGSATYAYTPVTTTTFTGMPIVNETGIKYLGNGGSQFGYNNALMLMPQTFPTDGTGGNFTFDYAITDMIGGAIASNTGETVYFGELGVNWGLGLRYVYVIDFTTLLESQPITFTVQVDSWTNSGNIDVVVPEP
ncbi:MAG: fimbrillin family protein [Rikenellaceae bacterium]|nr:fimbrillin family protein [Rikenellaceae bacterium]MCL2691953.1 fimbrillin family protein [Rikenellaceae bacterium]